MGLMDFLFGGTKQTNNQNATQNSTSATAVDPIFRQYSYDVLQDAKNAAANYNPVAQQAPVGFNDDQNTGMGMARNAATNNVGGDTLNSAKNAAQGVASYQPLNVTGQGYTGQGYNAAFTGPAATYSASDAGSQGYTAAQAKDAQGYTAQNGQAAQLNPNAVQNVSGPNSTAQLQNYLSSVSPQFQQSVIQPALDAINQQRIQALQGTDAQAAQAGAFGGDRQAIYDAETNRVYANQAGQLAGNLGLQGFQAATGLLQNDQGLGQQAALANQGANLSAATTNAGFAQQTGMANQGAQNSAAQYQADQANNFTLQNANFQNQASQFGAEAANQASLANANAANAAAQFGANAANTNAALNANAKNAAGQFGADATNTANAFSAKAANDASLANQNAGLAGAGLNLQGANSLAGMSDQERNNAFGNADALYSVGKNKQDYDQSVQDTNYNNDVAAANAPITRLGIESGGMAGMPYGSTTTSNGSSSGSSTGTQSTNPGLVGTGLTIAGMYASDQRLKTNIQPMNGTGSALDKVRKMKGVSYNWKGSKQPNLGLVAQDVERAIPAGVKTINGVKHVDGPAVIGLLVDSVNELSKKLDAKRAGPFNLLHGRHQSGKAAA